MTPQHDQAALDVAAERFVERYKGTVEEIIEVGKRARQNEVERGPLHVYGDSIFQGVQFAKTSYTFGLNTLNGILHAAVHRGEGATDAIIKELTHITPQAEESERRVEVSLGLGKKMLLLVEESAKRAKYYEQHNAPKLAADFATISAGVQALREEWIDKEGIKELATRLLAKKQHDMVATVQNDAEKAQSVTSTIAQKLNNFRDRFTKESVPQTSNVRS